MLHAWWRNYLGTAIFPTPILRPMFLFRWPWLSNAEIKGIFVHPFLAERIISMLNYFLQHLVGPKMGALKVKDFSEFDFKPQQLVSDICTIYLNLGYVSKKLFFSFYSKWMPDVHSQDLWYVSVHQICCASGVYSNHCRRPNCVNTSIFARTMMHIFAASVFFRSHKQIQTLQTLCKFCCSSGHAYKLATEKTSNR